MGAFGFTTLQAPHGTAFLLRHCVTFEVDGTREVTTWFDMLNLLPPAEAGTLQEETVQFHTFHTMDSVRGAIRS